MKNTAPYFAPTYNEVEQVKNCVKYMLNKEIASAEVIITIGHNGKEFCSSTEWLVKTIDGQECILPFKVNPQYLTYISMFAGREIKLDDQGHVSFIYSNKTAVLIMPEGDEHWIEQGSAIRIGVQRGNMRFIASDCDVQVIETEDKVFYRIMPNEHTHYASYKERIMGA